MNKKLFTLLIALFTCMLSFAQTSTNTHWEEKTIITDEITQSATTEYHYLYTNDDGMTIDVMVNPNYPNNIFICSSLPLGNFQVNIWTQSLFTYGQVKLYKADKSIYKTYSSTKIMLGSLTNNQERKQARFNVRNIYKYITENNGYVQLSYPTLNNGTINVPIPCIKTDNAISPTRISNQAEEEYNYND